MGHRLGKQKTIQEKSKLLVSSPEKRKEGEKQRLGAEAGANDVNIGKGAMGLAECREGEDGVMLGGPGEL